MHWHRKIKPRHLNEPMNEQAFDKCCAATLLQLIKYYHIDRIRISTKIPVRMLKIMIDKNLFKNSCKDIVIGRAYKMSRIHGYKSRIEIYQATDEVIKLLQTYRLGKHTISRIEIAREIVCDSLDTALDLSRKFIKYHFLKWGKGCFVISSTGYIGKREGIHKNFYVICYVPRKGKEKLGVEYSMHNEFVIIGWENIRKKLNIGTIYDIIDIEQCYNELSNKYLVEASPNFNRIKKSFENKIINNVSDVIMLISNEKDVLRERKLRHRALLIICDNRMRKRFKIKLQFNYTAREKRILNQGVGYWLNKVEKVEKAA